MDKYQKIAIIWLATMQIVGAFGQHKLSCDSVLNRAHKNLGNLYEIPPQGSGYTFSIMVSATYRNKTVGNAPPQRYRMAVAGETLLFESENLDSFQNDSMRISVVKTQNRIYIAQPGHKSESVSYMDQFNAMQRVLPQFMSVEDCNEVDGKIHLRATLKADTLGLSDVKEIMYIIKKRTGDIAQIKLVFNDKNPIANYTIAYSDIVKPYVMPSELIDRYGKIAQQSAAGSRQFEQYSIIDNRKKSIHD